MHKRYYKKKGATCKETVRCPLCGMHRRIGYFSQKHLFGVYQCCFGGYKKISWKLVQKPTAVLSALREGMALRLKELLEEFTRMKWYSELEVSQLINASVQVPFVPAVETSVDVPLSVPIATVIRPVLNVPIIPKKVVIE